MHSVHGSGSDHIIYNHPCKSQLSYTTAWMYRVAADYCFLFSNLHRDTVWYSCFTRKKLHLYWQFVGKTCCWFHVSCVRFSEKEAEVSPKKEESSACHAITKGYSHLYTHCPSQTVLYADMQVAITEHIKTWLPVDVQSRKHNCT